MEIILGLVKVITTISFLFMVLCLFLEIDNRATEFNYGIFGVGLILLWVL